MSEQPRYLPALAYHWLTPAYDTVVRLTTREAAFKSALLEQAALQPGEHVLDLACGTATLTIAAKLRQPGAVLTGIDADSTALDIARLKAAQAGADIRFDQDLSDALPYPDAAFDKVLRSLFFHHLQADAKRRTFAELHRVLKPGGELHVADWGRARNPVMRSAFFAIQVLDGFSNTAENVRGRLPAMMQEAGFDRVCETRHFATMRGTLSLYFACVARATAPAPGPPRTINAAAGGS